MIANIMTSVLVHGVNLKLLSCMGHVWLHSADLAVLFGYSGLPISGPLHRVSIEPVDTVLAKINGKGGDRRLYTEQGVRRICELVSASTRRPRAGVAELIAWLDEGGMQLGQQAEPAVEVELIPPPRPVPSLRLVPRGPDPMQQLLEREKAYCRDLVKTLLRYCESEDVDKLTGMVDGQIDHVLETRYCPGLNAARYELYRKYWMQGGGV